MAAYHSSGDDLDQILYRKLKVSIMTIYDREHWGNHSSCRILGIRSTFKDQLNKASAKFVYGITLRLHGEFLLPPFSP